MKLTKIIPKLPQDDKGAAQLISEIGDVYQEIEILKLDKKKKIKEIETTSNQLLRPLKRKKGLLLAAAFKYFRIHKRRLLDVFKKKSVTYDTGDVGWRLSGGELVVEDEDAAMAYLEGSEKPELVALVKVKKSLEVDKIKAAIKEADERGEPLEIPGVRIKPKRDRFWMHPNQLEKEIVIRSQDLPRHKFEAFIPPEKSS